MCYVILLFNTYLFMRELALAHLQSKPECVLANLNISEHPGNIVTFHESFYELSVKQGLSLTKGLEKVVRT